MNSEIVETLLFPTSIVVTAKEQLSCDLGGEEVILDLKSGTYFGLDAVGAHIWRLIQEPVSFSQLTELLISEYEVEQSQCESALTEFLTDLFNHGLVEIRT
jgi:hypothetical protein